VKDYFLRLPRNGSAFYCKFSNKDFAKLQRKQDTANAAKAKKRSSSLPKSKNQVPMIVEES
jgi:hypothetical protein